VRQLVDPPEAAVLLVALGVVLGLDDADEVLDGGDRDPHTVAEVLAGEAEEAFWDETDLTTLARGELTEEPRTDHADAPTPTVSYSVRLSRTDVERLRAAAARHGIGATSLARTYILRQLLAEEAAPSNPQAVLERLRQDVDDLSHALRAST
jgi:hypothetical protein